MSPVLSDLTKTRSGPDGTRTNRLETSAAETTAVYASDNKMDLFGLIFEQIKSPVKLETPTTAISYKYIYIHKQVQVPLVFRNDFSLCPRFYFVRPRQLPRVFVRRIPIILDRSTEISYRVYGRRRPVIHVPTARVRFIDFIKK